MKKKPELHDELQAAGQNVEELTVGLRYVARNLTDAELILIEIEAGKLLEACRQYRSLISPKRT